MRVLYDKGGKGGPAFRAFRAYRGGCLFSTARYSSTAFRLRDAVFGCPCNRGFRPLIRIKGRGLG